MTSTRSPSDLKSLQEKIALLEQQVIEQKTVINMWREFMAWANQIIADGVLHQATRDALKYLLNHQQGLQRYCEDGRLPISNIRAEHVAKTIAIPRKTYLFSDSKDGAKSSAILYSVIETARANRHDSHQYLTVVLTELPVAQTKEQIEALLPWNGGADQREIPRLSEAVAQRCTRHQEVGNQEIGKIEPAASPGSRYS